ncbi:efflux RND transporter periplasmic adaptor subunit [Azospirillum agricola]|uniref:efflux RND transporter periplasmic adaptor subunit n=1 Tax=Azospirillum agricola TaxID=1720247 RepID=UPI000A0F1ABF|nr:efflux RND transporter periplasmic adaptor subunit [Azospirillum agricola]SMH37910.1 membrane fusion protein, multidrug efflux system [Azospirillum lipoferum]
MTLDPPPKTETSFGHPAAAPGHQTPHGQPPGPPRKPVTRGRLIVRLVITVIILALLGAALYGFNSFRAKAISDFFANNKPPPTPVALAEATVQTVPKYLTAIGTVAAARQLTVAPEVAGRVVQIPFESGATVKAGDPLVQLNDATEQADLLALRAQARLAELNLERYRDLRRSQATPQSNVDQYQAQLDETNANMKRTQALIAQKLIKAPFDGELGIRQINVGDYVNTGATIVTLTDLSQLYVNFSLPEQTLTKLSVGQKVLINTDANPGRDFEATITTIEPQITADTRAIKVQATLDNRGRALRPGMFANVRVVLPPQPNTLTIPETAVDYTVYGDSVFVAVNGKDAEGKEQLTVKRQPVKVGDRTENKVEIREGLKPGDRVVVSGQLKLSNDAAVVPAESNPLTPPKTLPQN